jgi:hypothetical protein
MSDLVKELHDKLISTELESIQSCRRAAAQILEGSGAEFGAGDRPWPVPEYVNVKYFDDLSILDGYFPHSMKGVTDLNAKQIMELGHRTQDFVIGAHLFEHLEDPFSWLDQVFEVLKSNGKLLLAIPNKERTFDIDRKVTTYEHLLKDAIQGGHISREEHLIEHYRILYPRAEFAGKHLSEKELAVKVKSEMRNKDLNIHFHTFTLESLKKIIERYCDESDKFTLELIIPSINEVILLLNKKVGVRKNSH